MSTAELAKVYVLLDTDPEELGTPVVFKTVEAAKTFVSEQVKDVNGVGHYKRDKYSTYGWKEQMGMGVGKHWTMVYNGVLTFTIYEQLVHESGDPKQVWDETG